MPKVSKARNSGKLKAANVPTPLDKADDPDPAKVVTDPVGATLRIRLLPESATNTVPVASTAISLGKLNIATERGPSRNPIILVEPERTDTAPVGETKRI